MEELPSAIFLPLLREVTTNSTSSHEIYT